MHSRLCRRSAPNDRPYWIIMGLLYPGILGALMFDIGPLLHPGPSGWNSQQVLLFVLLIHYALDYAYSADDTSKQEYSWCKFFVDFAIVWLLYAALTAAKEGVTDLLVVIRVCWLMFFTSVCAVVWELFGRERPDKARRVAVVTDGIPCVGYGLLIFFYKSNALIPQGLVWLLIVVVVLDSVLYWFHEWLYRLWSEVADRG